MPLTPFQKEVLGLLAADVGCLYLDAGGAPCTPDPADPQFPQIKRHFGSVLGAWPKPA